MGTWGISVFSDDTAQDVRDEWIDAFKTYASAKKATAAVRKDMREEFADSDDGPVATLALALTLWKYGCLDATTKRQALQVVDKKRGLDRWRDEGPKLEAARLAEYAKVRTKLCSKQPPSKDGKRKPLKFEDSGLRTGDVFSIPLKSSGVGRGYFRVVGEQTNRESRDPVVQLLKLAPNVDAAEVQWKKVNAIGIRNYSNSSGCNHRFRYQVLWGWKAREWDRACVVIHTKLPLSSSERKSIKTKYASGICWANLDEFVIPSLDESHWPMGEDAYEMYRRMPLSKIAGTGSCLKLAKQRIGDIGSVSIVPAILLIYRDGDYARAERILRLVLAFDADYSLHVELGHALFGLGKVQEAEAQWRRALTKKYSWNASALSYTKRQIEWARTEVMDRRAGKPHKVPSNLIF